MGLKILHSADWHMDAAFSSFSPEQRRILRHQQLQLPEKIAQVCRQENCHLVLLAGDIFDSEPTREGLDAVKAALEECGVPVFVSPGNHDFCCPGSPWVEEVWPENVYVFTGALESVALPALDCRIYGAGYRSMDCPGLLENFRAAGDARYQIALLHADPVTKHSPYCPITASQIRNSGLTYLALGHIHKAGMLRLGGTLCAWPGCPMGRGWDETGEKGVCIVTPEAQKAVRFLPLDVPGFYDLEAEISDDPVQALERLMPAGESEDFYRLTLTGQGMPDLPALKTHFSRFPNLQIRDRTRPPEDLWEDTGEDSLRGIYFRMLRQLRQEDPRAQLAAEISRRILSGREVELP